MRNIVWHIQIAYGVLKKTQKLIPRYHIYIYMRNIVWHIHVLQKAETFIILEASGLPKAETFTILHSPMFAKSLQKSSKHVQPRNSSVEHLWNIKSVLLKAFEALGAAA